MQNYMDAPDLTLPRASHEPYNTYPQFTDGPVYPEPSQHFFDKQSPHLSPYDSPELRAPPSNLSTASGPSASSSTMGSPYSNSGHNVPGPEVFSGLGIGPSIAGGHYDYEGFSYHVSDIEDLNNFQDVNKSFVGECGVSSGSSSSSIPTRAPTMAAAAAAYNAAQSGSNAMTRQSSLTTHTSSASFQSSSPRASSYSPLSSRRVSVLSLGNSGTAGRTQDAQLSQPSFNFSSAPSYSSESLSQSSHSSRSQFFSQTSGQFVPPLQSQCSFPLTQPPCTRPLSLDPRPLRPVT